MGTVSHAAARSGLKKWGEAIKLSPTPPPRTPAASPGLCDAIAQPPWVPRVEGVPLVAVGVGTPGLPAARSVPALGCCSHLRKMPPPFSPPANLSCRELAPLHRCSLTPAEEPGHAANAFVHGFPSPLAVCSPWCRSPMPRITSGALTGPCPTVGALCRVLPGRLCLGRALGSVVRGCRTGQKAQDWDSSVGKGSEKSLPCTQACQPPFS